MPKRPVITGFRNMTWPSGLCLAPISTTSHLNASSSTWLAFAGNPEAANSDSVLIDESYLSIGL